MDYDGIRVTVNMSKSTRYQAFTNSGYEFRRRVDPPGADYEADTPLAESVTTSIQPHYQVPYAPDLPEYFAYALRVAGPLLAVGVNSPFLPPELYDAPETALADGWHENRVAAFEGVLNPADDRAPKVRFPRDIDTVEEAVDRIAEDEPAVPLEPPERARYDDRYRHLRHKHGSYWRWVRPVFDAPDEAAANARVEFRALPAQPTIRDSVAFLAVFAGLVEGMVRAEHPVRQLDWQTARENFYAAVANGLAADFEWLTADGEETTATDRVYQDLFAAARAGLAGRGLSDETIEGYLRPLRGRVRRGTTPAGWKRDRVREALDEGADFQEAVERTQRAYVRRQRETLLRRTFLEWLDDAA